jgi:hypothetical protein
MSAQGVETAWMFPAPPVQMFAVAAAAGIGFTPSAGGVACAMMVFAVFVFMVFVP